MKKLLLLLLLTSRLVAQTTLFSENIGAPGGTIAIGSYTGWQNKGTLMFSGTGDVRTTTPSTGYSGASGSGSVFLTNNGTANFIISGINTTGFESGSFTLKFGALKTTTASTMSELNLAYSTNGTSYTSISIPAQATGTGSAVWRSISLSSLSLPSTTTLFLKWTNTGTSPQFRLDDISLTGITAVPEPSTYAAMAGAIALLGVIVHRRRQRVATKA